MTFRKHWPKILAGVIAVFVLGGSWVRLTEDPEPRYDGVTIESWFYDETGLGSSECAVRAYEAVGEAWVPYLIEKGKRPDKPMAGFPHLVYSLMPRFVRSQIGIIRHPGQDRGIAFSYLTSLHSMDAASTEAHYLDPFVPELMEAANSTKDKDARRFLRGLLVDYVLKLEDDAVKKQFFLQDTKNPSAPLRFEAFVNLSTVDATMTNGIPLLTKVLTDRSWVISAFGLNHLQVDGSISMLDRAVHVFQKQARDTLARIAPDEAAKYELPEEALP